MPAELDKQAARTAAGDKFDETAFDGAAASDGTITREQFLALAIIPVTSEVCTLFELIDDDDDGFIDQGEATQAARALGCEPDTFWRLLLKHDSDGDGKLSLIDFNEATVHGQFLSAFFDPVRGARDSGLSLVEQASQRLLDPMALSAAGILEAPAVDSEPPYYSEPDCLAVDDSMAEDRPTPPSIFGGATDVVARQEGFQKAREHREMAAVVDSITLPHEEGPKR